jgi:hypothetical protein
MNFEVKSIIERTRGTKNYSFLMSPSMWSPTTQIHYEVNSIVEWTRGKIIHFSSDHHCGHQSYRFTTKWTQLLNELLLKIIHFSFHLQCGHQPHRFATKWTQLLNELLIIFKIIHFSCYIQCCHKLQTVISLWTELLNEFLIKTIVSHVIFNVVTSCKQSFRYELNCWMNSC